MTISGNRTASTDPAFAWREQIQNRVRTLLAASPSAKADLTLAQWRTVKAGWRRFVRQAARGLIERERTPLTARLVGEHAGPGFRVQNLVFETFPGWLVGLNLFLPEGAGPFVPVLCPCGHGPKWFDDHQFAPQVLARRGFAAALFDMPMCGEKCRDNDHFIQGAQAAMVGRWSNEFFMLDALRTADYLETRSDITFTHGMGVTGVSGGGFATQCLAQLDPRVRAIVPVCFATPLGAHIVDGLYTGCPENIIFGQAAAGFDLDDWLGLAAPTPCLVVSGRQDTMFTPESVGRSVDKTRRLYALEGAADRLDWYEEDVPHKYTVKMAERAALWFQRWLDVHGATSPELGRRASPEPCPRASMDEPVTLLPQAVLDCGTAATTTAMLDITRIDEARLRSARKAAVSRQDIVGVLRLSDADEPITVEDIGPASQWGYPGLRHRAVGTSDGLALPLIDMPCPGAPEGVLVCFTEGAPLTPLRQAGGLCGARCRMFSASLRGFGALTPAPTDYDIYPWCAVDRALSDLLALCGDTALGVQTADALRVIGLAGAEQPGKMAVYGRGEAALPALFAGILNSRVTQVVLDAGLACFAMLATAPRPAWRRYSYLPDVLGRFDLPELLAGHPEKQFLVLNPLDAEKRRLDEAAALKCYGSAPNVTVRVGLDEAPSAAAVREWLDRKPEAKT
jgi:hypothetical protein